MATSGTNITKATVVDSFNGSVTNPLNAVISWHIGSYPMYPGGAASGSYQSGSPGTGILGGSSNAGMSATDIPDTVVTASTIVNAYRYYAGLSSRVRSVRYIKYYNNNGSWGAFYDGTAYMNYSSNFVNPADPGTVAQGGQISAPTLNALIKNMYDQAVTYKDTTVTYSEYWCHYNCHNNYGARSRR